MSVTTEVTSPVVRAIIDRARSKNWTGGVLGVRARPVWREHTEFEHDGMPVQVVPCESALAVREALLDRDPRRWLVVLCDRPEHELGDGVRAHLVGERMQSPDLWEAVRERFKASRIDHRLRTRELALALLTATPATGWPPAPGGLLTPDHVYGATAASHLGFEALPAEIDRTAVLAWTTDPDAAARLSGLRALAGPALADPVVDWLAGHCGAIEAVVQPLLRSGRGADVVPLGLVARAASQTAPGSGPRALLRQGFGVHVRDEVLSAWADAAEESATALLDEGGNPAAAVLARADALLTELEADAHAEASNVLGRGLTERLSRLGEALRRATERADSRASAHGVDAALADPEWMPAVEGAWQQVEAHRLSSRVGETRVPRAHAGVRLARWLAGPSALAEPAAFGAHVDRHRDVDAWVDRAVADAWVGVDDAALSRGLRAVLRAVRMRRDTHDIAFARALAAHEGAGEQAPPGAHHLEDVLARLVLPLAKRQPVLLVVADGMSMAAGTEIVESVVERYHDAWVECIPARLDRRVVGLSLLPSLTTVSRTSLLCGERVAGEAKHETDGFEELCHGHGLRGKLFHKGLLDQSEAGFALAHDVAAAVDDTTGAPVVACVLNTIDDALDRSDPGGVDWTDLTVKHLNPLLHRARSAGRVVVLTADHGHVVERRDGYVVTRRPTSSNRSRPAAGDPPGDGEIRVRGDRVLMHDGDAVLAVDERLRYGPLKAGYHGGASPAEVVVPVCVLATGNQPDGWEVAAPQSPGWWRTAVTSAERATPASRAADQATPTLFDEHAPEEADDLVAAVQRSRVYRAQRAGAQRIPLDDGQVAGLLRALLAAPGHRLDRESAAAALRVPTVNLAGALPAVQRLVNVEQYPVVSRDPDGDTIVLDENLLREQFEVGS